MMVVSNTLLRKQSTSQKGQSLPFTLVAGRPNGCFFMVQQPCPGSLSPGLLANACTITYLTRWKERGTIRFIPELVHNLASALALRAPLAKGFANAEIMLACRLFTLVHILWRWLYLPQYWVITVYGVRYCIFRYKDSRLRLRFIY